MVKLHHSWTDLESSLNTLVRKILLDGWKPDVVIGPGRGGYIPGVMLSHYYNIPFEGFTWQTRDGDVEDSVTLEAILSKYNNRNILIIDDINDSGTTLHSIHNFISGKTLISDIRYATIYEKVTSSFDTDWCAIEIQSDQEPWIVFPYEEWWT